MSNLVSIGSGDVYQLPSEAPLKKPCLPLSATLSSLLKVHDVEVLSVPSLLEPLVILLGKVLVRVAVKAHVIFQRLDLVTTPRRCPRIQ